MTHKIISQVVTSVISGVILAAAALVPMSSSFAQDSATYDAVNKTWNLRYKDPEIEQWINKTYITAAHIYPAVRTTVSLESGDFKYSYHIKNGSNAGQDIVQITIWDIPLTFYPADLPKVTADLITDGQLYKRQFLAKLSAIENFSNSIVQSPPGWSGDLVGLDTPGKSKFVWIPGLEDEEPNGIPPGGEEKRFAVLRPELPGVVRMRIEGNNPEPWMLGLLPESPFWDLKVKEIMATDHVVIPVLAPAIAIPSPYVGAELGRRIQAHYQTWPKYGHATQAFVDELNREFAVLLPALDRKDKRQVRHAFIRIVTRLFMIHRGMVLAHALDGHPRSFETALMQSGASSNPIIDRTAARALVYSLYYLLVQSERGK